MKHPCDVFKWTLNEYLLSKSLNWNLLNVRHNQTATNDFNLVNFGNGFPVTKWFKYFNDKITQLIFQLFMLH